MPSELETLKAQLIERHGGDAEKAAGELTRLAESYGLMGPKLMEINKDNDLNRTIEALIELVTRASVLRLLQSEK